MSRKKGLSLEEKRKRMLDYLLEHKEVYRLRDLEMKLPKVTGITSMTVKEVLQSLVDDNLVETDKIGSGNFFWSFPSKAVLVKKGKVSAAAEEIAANEAKLEALGGKKRQLLEGREESDERSAKLARLGELREEKVTVDAQLAKYADSDPELLKEKHDAVSACTDAANRWTDNIFALLSHFKEMRPELSQSDVLKNFGLPADLDYIA